MRLMHLISSGGWGGREMYPPLLASEQKLRGHRVSLVAKTNTALARRLAGSELEYELIDIKSRTDFSAARSLSRILRSRQPELIHLHLSRDLILARLACALARIKPALILHQHVAVSGSKGDPFHRYLYAKLSAVVAISEYVRESMEKRWPVRGKRLEVIYYGLKTEIFTGPEEEKNKHGKNSLRAELGVDGEEQILVGLVGRLEPRKGQEIFLRAAARVQSPGPNLRFALVGAAEGGYDREMKALADELGIAGRVVFTGHRPDVPELLRALDVLVVPSLEEAFGLVAAEGMLSSLPVVAARAGALPEFIDDGSTGLLVPPSDPQALADSLLRLADDPDLRGRLGSQARAWATENLSMERCLDRLDNLYQECVGRP
jgi:glycosyltransferase involved in cell wall biosynthesis